MQLSLHTENTESIFEIFPFRSILSSLAITRPTVWSVVSIFSYRLINFLRTSKIESDASGGIDNVTLALQLGLLFAIEINDITKREDAEGKVS